VNHIRKAGVGLVKPVFKVRINAELGRFNYLSLFFLITNNNSVFLVRYP